VFNSIGDRVCIYEQVVICRYLCDTSKVTTNLILAYKLESGLNLTL
jgi:hypothetical protein